MSPLSLGFGTITPSFPSTTAPKHHNLCPPQYPETQFRNVGIKLTPLRATSPEPENSAPSSTTSAPPVAVTTAFYEQPTQSPPLTSASAVVRNFYDGINRRDLAAVEGLIASNCIYEDLIFPTPFVGRKAILEFFGKFIDYISKDLLFVIDAISEEDSSSVGVTWHLEWNRKPFPFSKGCSFYQLEIVNGARQITFARDCVEPAVKPGESALIVIRGVTWLLQQFPKLADWL